MLYSTTTFGFVSALKEQKQVCHNKVHMSIFNTLEHIVN